MEAKLVGNEVNVVNVQWTKHFEKTCLRIEIIGHLTEKNAEKAVSEWKEEIKRNSEPGEKRNIICNCLKMKGYDTEARKIWQQTISELKSEIDCMWIISDNKMFKIAANTMGFISRINIKTANSEQDICFEK